MEEKRLSLGEHLEELRRRVIRSLIIIAGCVITAFVFHEQFMRIICKPHFDTMSSKLKILAYPEGFIVPFKASLVAGLIIAAPYILYQVWEFIKAGLYPRERKYVLLYALFSLFLFSAGVLFGYFIFIPMCLKILYKFIDPNLFEPAIRLNDYFSLFIMLTLMLGLVFEIPLVMLFLTQLGLVSPKSYLTHYKIIIIGSFVLGAMITPDGNPLNQTMVAGLLLSLYAVGVTLSFLIFRKQR
ncbi:MAG: twin-arginine translocase subunit TatC [Planctomycetota bacterium]